MGLFLTNVKSLHFPHTLPSSFRIDDQGCVRLSEPQAPGDELVDCGHGELSPGWIDLHTHVYHKVTSLGLDPVTLALNQGVTVLVDAGSAGCVTYEGLRDFIIAQQPFTICSFLNLGGLGLVWCGQISELDSREKVDLPGTLACIRANRKTIRGIKVRACGVIFRDNGIEMLRMGRLLAEETDLPLMVHIGEPLPMLDDTLDLLRPGDVVTHCFHGKVGALVRRGKVIPQAWAAKERGVLFDIGHGGASFSFATAEAAIQQGFLPDTISTDLHKQSRSLVKSLALTASKLVSLGVSREQVLSMISTAPARAIGEEDYLNGVEGRKARFTLHHWNDTPMRLADSIGEERTITPILCPDATIVGTQFRPVSKAGDAS